MGQSLSQLGADASGTVSARHLQAWTPYVSIGGALAPALSKAFSSLVPASRSLGASERVSLAAFLEAAGVSLESSAASQLGAALERSGPSAAVSPILATGVSSEDLLITLNVLVEDASASDGGDAGDEAPGSVAGVEPSRLQNLQEALDQLVERTGPEGEGRRIQEAELTSVLGQTLPLLQWAALSARLSVAIGEQGMADDGTNHSAAAPAASASSSSAPAAAAASSTSRSAAGKKSSAASSSSGGFGGGLDLSISGFSIKPPAGHPSAKK